MVIPKSLFLAIKKVQDTVLISPPIISQLAAIGAHQAPYEFISEKLKVIQQSRKVCLDTLNQSGLLLQEAYSEGAFYIFAKLNIHMDDLKLAKTLIQQHGIATIPGSAFAAPDGTYLRISYGALTSESVELGIKKLTSGLKALS
jgi:aspartate/methionine/tyrosine aminotransferase